MKYVITALRTKSDLEEAVAEGDVRFLTTAQRFYDTKGWVEEVETFGFAGYLEMNPQGVFVDGRNVFARIGDEWYAEGVSLPFQQIYITPEMS